MNRFPTADELRAQARHFYELARRTDDPDTAVTFQRYATQYELLAHQAEIEGAIH